MNKREELVRTEEYWFETLQNEIYRIVSEYIEKEGMNKTQFADKIGVSKGYVSQILNGNFNATLKKLIELSLAIDVVPSIEFKNIVDFIEEDKVKHFNMQYQQFFNLIAKSKTTSFKLRSEGNIAIKESSGELNCLNAA